MLRITASTAVGRAGRMCSALVVGMFSVAAARGQQPPAQQSPPQPPAQQSPPRPPAQRAGQAQQASQPRMFNNDGGMILNFVKPDKTADFEKVIAKLKEALQKSGKRERKQQAQGWKIFKSPEPATGGNVLYIFVMYPSVKNADYSVANLLGEALPFYEVNELFKEYAGAYAQVQNIVNLQLIADLGQ